MQPENLLTKTEERAGIRKTILILAAVLLLLCLVFGFKNISGSQSGHTLLINEVMTSNRLFKADEDGDFSDWIEILNAGDYPVKLKDYGLSDNKQQLFKWRFPDITIQPGQVLVVFASGKDKNDPSGNLHTNFKIDSKGETILLSGEGQIIDQVEVPEMPPDTSYGRKINDTRDWAYFSDSTAGEHNTTNDYEKPVIGTRVVNPPVLINEIMTSNKSSIVDEDGEHSDWIEIVNISSQEINLEGYGLSDDSDDPFKWKFPDILVKPNQCIVVFSSGKDRRDTSGKYLHTNFKLSSESESLLFSTNDGQILDQLQIRPINPNVSYGRKEGEQDKWLFYPMATPGDANYTQGFESLSDNLSLDDKKIIINEAMALNLTSIKDEDGEYTDWIEIVNSGNTDVNLKGYGLSDDAYNPLKWKFPDYVIRQGQCIVVFASGKDRYNTDKKVFHTNFSLGREGETIVLSDESGRIIDELITGGLPADLSCGRKIDSREGRLYFQKATPGEPNTTEGYERFAEEIEFSLKGGYYSEPAELTLKTKSPNAVIHYTLDGSEPTVNSAAFTSPILIEKTSVVKARAFEDSCLPGPVSASTYFINKRHTLSVVSLSTDPSNLWDIDDGIYVKGKGASEEFPYVGANFWKDMEKPVHFEFFEADGKPGLSFNGGIKIFGAYSRAMDQKSFSIYARDRYEYDRINYPFFEDKGIMEFKSILLRTSGQDATMTKIRDAMMARLIKDTGVDYQAYRPVVVYLNGEYWGLYNIREKISPYFLASNHGADPENVDILEANGRIKAGDNKDYKALVSYVTINDLRRAENYEYVKSKMDIENFMDYQIAEIYFANTDNGNIKFWRERSEGGKWRWILYDTDWGFYNVNHNTLWYVTNAEGTGVGQNFSTALMYNLLKNDDFKTQFINRLAYHLNNTFEAERVISVIDEMAKAIESEMPENLERWGGSMNNWYNQVEKLRNFARQRPKILSGFIKDQFKLSSEEMKIFNIY